MPWCSWSHSRRAPLGAHHISAGALPNNECGPGFDGGNHLRATYKRLKRILLRTLHRWLLQQCWYVIMASSAHRLLIAASAELLFLLVEL